MERIKAGFRYFLSYVLVACLLASNIILAKVSAISTNIVETYYYGTNSNLCEDDATTGALPIGFTFNYFGTPYTQAVMSTNGVLFLGTSGVSDYTETPLQSGTIKNAVAAFWDDLVDEGFGTSAMKKTIYYQTIGTSGHHLFIAQWTNQYYYSNPSLQMGTFQAILYEDTGAIQIQYRTLINGDGTGTCYGSSAAIGIVNSDASKYDQYCYDQPDRIQEKQAIRYTPDGNGGYTINTDAAYEPVYLIDPSSPSVPQLASGVLFDGATDVSTHVNLQWTPCTNATSYRVLVAKDSTFSSANTVVDYTTAETSYQVTGLSYGTKYYWRVEAINDYGSNMSNVSTFTTVAQSSLADAAVSAADTADVHYDSATFNGTVNNCGKPAISQYGFVWSTASGPTVSDHCIQLGTRYSTGSFSADVTGLQPSTTYYVRIFATNDVGTVYGSETSFTTPSYPAATFMVKDGNTPLQGASVAINGLILTTDENGQVQTNLANGSYNYSISKEGYTTQNGTAAVNYGTLSTDISMVKTIYSVAITVKDGTSPVAGATVRVGEATALTDGNGNATFSLPYGTYPYTASKTGYADTSGTATIAGNGGASGTGIDLSASRLAYNLTITVKDGTAPVDGASVSLDGRTAATDANGQAAFTGLPWGSYTYAVSKTGYTDTNGTATIDGSGGASGTITDVSSARLTYGCTITVRDGADPVGGASVRLGAQTVTTDVNGNAVFTALPWGDYAYTVSKTEYSDKTGTASIAANGDVSGTSVDLNSSRTAYPLTIEVKDGATPILGAVVSIGGSTATTDASGNAVFTALPWGNYPYTVSAAGYSDTTGTASVAANGDVSGATADLNSSRTAYPLTIAVNDGKVPVQGATVHIGDRTATTDASGNAVFTALPWGTYPYTVSGAGYSDTTGTASIAANGGAGGTSVDLNSSRTAYPLTIEVKDGAVPVQGAMVHIGDKAVTTDANGDAVFSNLPWGVYEYTVTKTAYSDMRGTADIGSDGKAVNTSSDFSLSHTAHGMTIAVKDGAMPITGAVVSIGSNTATTDANGNAVFSDLPWGNYAYTVTAPFYSTITGSTFLPVGGSSASVAMTYSDRDGDGVPDIRDKYPDDPSRSYDITQVNPDQGTDHSVQVSDAPADAPSGSVISSQSASITSGELHNYQSGDTSVIRFGQATVTIPVEILDSKIGTDLTSTIQVKLTEENTSSQASVSQILLKSSDSNLLRSFDFSMAKVYSDGTIEPIHQMDGKIKISLPVASLNGTDPESLAVYFCDPATGTVQDMHAVYDALTESMVFYTTHFSNYVIAQKQNPQVPNTGDHLIPIILILLATSALSVLGGVLAKRKLSK